MTKIPQLTTDAIPVSRNLAVRFGMCEAFLIQQLHFLLCTHSKITDGVPWHYKSYREWADELMVYGVSTIRTALKHLEDEDVIRVGNFNQKAYDQTKWYTLNYALVGSLEDERLSNFDSPPIKIQQGAPVNFQQTYTRDEVNKEIDKEKLPLPTPSAKAGKKTGFKIILGKQTETTVDIDMKTPSSANAILQGLKVANGTAPSSANTSKSLQAMWRRLVPKHHPTVGMLPELTVMQRGQLAHIAKRLGVEADRTVQHVLPNWIGFCKFVEAQAGLKKTPDVPQIGFLLKYVTEAVNYVKEDLQLTAPKKLIKAPSKPLMTQTLPTPSPKMAEAPKPPLNGPKQVPAEQPTSPQDDEMADADFMLNWKPPSV